MNFMQTVASEKKALRQAFIRFLPIPIVLVILCSLLISYDYFTTRRHMLVHEQQDYIVEAMIDYRDTISAMTSIMRTIETDYLSLTAKDAAQEDFVSLFMDNMILYPYIDKLRILDINGMEILRLNHDDGTPYVVSKENLQNKSERYFYDEAKVLGRHQYLFSALDLNMDNGIIEINPVTGLPKPTLRITTPIDINEQRFGYLVVNFLMRDTLDKIRNFINTPGCTMLMFDEFGYLYNDADDSNNFGFCYSEGFVQYGRTILDIFPEMDLTQRSGWFLSENKLCSYTMFPNIYDRSKDYFLAEIAAKEVGFLLCYDSQSPYQNYLWFSYFYHLVASWKTQVLVWAGIVLLYILVQRLLFVFDRTRFTNLFADNRYAKSTLRQAIRNHEFVNYYQPIINIQDGTMLGIEALSRWKTGGEVLPPSEFIDEVLHYQLGQMLDENVFLNVREDRKRMEAMPCFTDTFISINCCQQTFDSLIKEPPTTIISLIEDEKKYIVLELLEDIVFNKQTQERIRDLYKHNIIFAIDDFGTGNSNIAFIRSFENLKVKIDRTFVPVDTNNKKERVIIEAFVKMFIDQGLKMIVEGVETLEQIRYLKTLGIQGVQGFYFSQPMTIDELIDFMDKRDYLNKL
ncbi:MAG TPA: EAL domain-containing protein [Candidatus Limiplasma sp.]|nr:EAL domain-containing protein [Candidatus Limiplasma sp.]HRX08181.1 EAL domain-containing protein [Candidatus Limiplasma sp.]